MKQIFYRSPDSTERVAAFVLWEEDRKALLFVPPLKNVRGATLTIAECNQGDTVFEDSDSNSFPLKDWASAAMIAVFLFFIIHDNLIEKPTNYEK